MTVKQSMLDVVSGYINRGRKSVSTPSRASGLFGTDQFKDIGKRTSASFDDARNLRKMDQDDANVLDQILGREEGTQKWGNFGAASSFGSDMAGEAMDFFSAKGYGGNRWGAGAARVGMAGAGIAAADFVNPFGFGWND